MADDNYTDRGVHIGNLNPSQKAAVEEASSLAAQSYLRDKYENENKRGW